MNYYWGTCPACGHQVTVQFEDGAAGLRGSLRRWSTNREVNDGRRLDVARAAVSADGGFAATCVCGATIPVAGAAIEHATTERPRA